MENLIKTNEKVVLVISDQNKKNYPHVIGIREALIEAKQLFDETKVEFYLIYNDISFCIHKHIHIDGCVGRYNEIMNKLLK